MTLEEVAGNWLELVRAKVERGARKPRTLEHYSTDIRVHILPAFGSMRIAEITAQDIRAFLDAKERELGYHSIHGVSQRLAGIMEMATRKGLIARNPMPEKDPDALRAVKPKGNVRAFDESQVRRLLETADYSNERYAFLFKIAIATGLRFGELAALTWADVDMERTRLIVSKQWSGGRIETPKNGRRREVPFSAELLPLFRLHRGDKGPEGLVFTGTRGSRIENKTVNGRIKAYAAKAGIPGVVNFHMLRHTCISLLISKGERIQYVQQLAGHASVSFTLAKYGSWLPMESAGVGSRIAEKILLGGQKIT